MNKAALVKQIRQKESFLCIGLDPDPDQIPSFLQEYPDPVLEFNRRIIEATHDLCVAYKPNTAFFEAGGSRGWETLEKTISMIPPGILRIADAKRGDIGNTAARYATGIFDTLQADAITLSPYMGKDSIEPFISRTGKWAIVLAITSNPGALDFQFLETGFSNTRLFEKVIEQCTEWASPEQLMFVAGATRAELLGRVRELAPDYFLLVPGVGVQGGKLDEVCHHGMNQECGLLVNASRSIIFASSGEDFAEKAREAAGTLQQEMASLLRKHNII